MKGINVNGRHSLDCLECVARTASVCLPLGE
jgi:hypothetical protein